MENEVFKTVSSSHFQDSKLVTGSRSVCCLPFTLAAATVLHVIKEVEPCSALDYKNELMDVLNLTLSRVCVLFT